MIYIVKQWRYKWEDSFVNEFNSNCKAFSAREKAVDYIESDIESKSTLDTVNVDSYEENIFKEVFHGKYGDKYQIIELELN